MNEDLKDSLEKIKNGTFEEDSKFILNIIKKLEDKNIDSTTKQLVRSVFDAYLDKFSKIMLAEDLEKSLPLFNDDNHKKIILSLIEKKKEISIVENIITGSNLFEDFPKPGFMAKLYNANVGLDYVSKKISDKFAQLLLEDSKDNPEYTRKLLLELDTKSLNTVFVSKDLVRFLLSENIFDIGNSTKISRIVYLSNKHFPDLIYERPNNEIQSYNYTLNKVLFGRFKSSAGEDKSILDLSKNYSKWLKIDEGYDEDKVRIINKMDTSEIFESFLWISLLKKHEPKTFEVLEKKIYEVMDSYINYYDDGLKRLIFLSKSVSQGFYKLDPSLFDVFEDDFKSENTITYTSLFTKKTKKIADLILDEFDNALNCGVFLTDSNAKVSSSFFDGVNYKLLSSINSILPKIIKNEPDETKKSLLSLICFIMCKPFHNIKDREIRNIEMLKNCLPEHIELLKETIRNIHSNENEFAMKNKNLLSQALISIEDSPENIRECFKNLDVVLEEELLNSLIKDVPKSNKPSKIRKF